MRHESIICDVCGDGIGKGRIREYCIIEPHGYVLGYAPFNRPSINIDMHEDCAAVVLDVIETGWTIVLDAAMKAVDK